MIFTILHHDHIPHKAHTCTVVDHHLPQLTETQSTPHLFALHAGRKLGPTIGRTIIFQSIFSALTSIFHLSAKSLDLLAHDAPKQEMLELTELFAGFWKTFYVSAVPSAGSNDHEETSDEGFLKIGEAEAFCDLRNGLRELGWEFDASVLGQLRSPVIAIFHPLRRSWQREVVLAIESARAFGDSSIQSF